jgi:hypothetical protein
VFYTFRSKEKPHGWEVAFKIQKRRGKGIVKSITDEINASLFLAIKNCKEGEPTRIEVYALGLVS